MKPLVVWMDGDAQGSELTQAARSIFKAVAPETAQHLGASFGWQAWSDPKAAAEALAKAQKAKAIFIGGIATKPEASDAKPSMVLPQAPVSRLRQSLGLTLQRTAFEEQQVYTVSSPPLDFELQSALQAAHGQSLSVLQEADVLHQAFKSKLRALQADHLDVKLREIEPLPGFSRLLSASEDFAILLCDKDLSPAVLACLAYHHGGLERWSTCYQSETQACFTPLAPAQKLYMGQGYADPLPAFQAVRQMLSYLQMPTQEKKLAEALSHLQEKGPRPLARGGDALGEAVTRFLLEDLEG